MIVRISRLLLGVLILSPLFWGCRAKTAKVAVQKPNPKAVAYLAEGDAHFRKGHLYGWRRAEALYAKAYAENGSEDIRRKLLLTRFLILTRQTDEDIPCPEAEQTAADLCAGDPMQKAFCEIARWHIDGKKDMPPDAKNLAFATGDEALDAYLGLLTSGIDLQGGLPPNVAEVADKFKDGPLFLYLAFGKKGTGDPSRFENSFPEFAEGFEFAAEIYFQAKKYRPARTYFRKAVDLIPDYSRATIGLGNIYFFALEDYEQALQCYESALDRDQTNIPALFGKGASLHHLAKYADSDAVLDRVLVRLISRNNRMNPDRVRYYSGETNYLKAYNHYLMKDPAKARELIDAARRIIPESENAIDLSGVLHFEARELEPARRDFLDVIAKGSSNCNALYHLGMIYEYMDPPSTDLASKGSVPKTSGSRYQENWASKGISQEERAILYFLGSADCMQTGVRSLNDLINSVANMDLEPDEKTALRDRLQKRLAEARSSYTSMLKKMIAEISMDTASTKEKSLELLKEVLQRMQL